MKGEMLYILHPLHGIKRGFNDDRYTSSSNTSAITSKESEIIIQDVNVATFWYDFVPRVV